MASPYSGLAPDRWVRVTQNLIDEHPLDPSEIVEVVLSAWDSIFSSKLGPKRFHIGKDIFPKPQIMGFFLHELIPLELTARYPNEWRGDERCLECGECLLEYTGGICPLTACTKSLINGACGGASQGKCELDPEKDCGWELIYERLKQKNQLDKLKTFILPKSWDKMRPNPKIHSTALWALEKSG